MLNFADQQPLFYVKVEPWNSIRVWIQLPIEASERLKTLANEQAAMLRDLGVLTVDIKEENSVISFNLQSENTAVSSSSTIIQDTSGGSLSAVNSLISLDSHDYYRSQRQEVSENSQELNILTSQRSNTCRKTNENKNSTLSVIADRERCCNSKTCTKLNLLSFHCKTAAETMDSNDKMVTSQIADSACAVSETGPSAFKSLMNDQFVASHGMTQNGFRKNLLNHLDQVSGARLCGGRNQGNNSFQQNYKSAKVSLPYEQSVCNSRTLKQSGCLSQSQVGLCSDSVTVNKSCEAKTHVGGSEHFLSLPSDPRQTRKRKSHDLDEDARLSVLPHVMDNCYRHSIDYSKIVAGGCNASEAESGMSVSFKSLPQHSRHTRCIINPYTGEMENVPDDDTLVMPHCAETSVAVSNKLPNDACYSTNPATVSGNRTFGGFTVSSNGHNVLLDADCFVSVDNFLQSILARLEASSPSDNHLLNLLNSVADKKPDCQLLTESVAKAEQPIMSLSSPQMQVPQLNGIGHCMIIDDHSKRPLSNPILGTVGDTRHVLGLVCEHQNASADSVDTCKGVLDVSRFHSGTKALQLQHSTEISSENTSSQMNARHITQQSTLGTKASRPSTLHQLQVAGCNPGITVSKSNGGQKFQKDVQNNLGNMVVQVGGATVSAGYQLQKVTHDMLRTMASQLNVGRQLQQVKYHHQVKDTLGHVNHEFQQITDFPLGNAAYADAYKPLQKVPGTLRTAASRFTPGDQLQQLSGTSEKTAFQMCTYRNTNGLSQNMVSEKISLEALSDFQSLIVQTDAISSGKKLVLCSTGKEGTSSSSITSTGPISEVGHYGLTNGNLLNGSFRHIPQTEKSIMGRGALSASIKTAESQQPSAHKCPIKKSRSRDQSKRTSFLVGKNLQASSLTDFVHGRQTKPVTKSQPTVAQLLDEARAKQAVSASAQVIPPAVMSTTTANSTTVSSILEAHTTGTWQKQMQNVALINLLPYSQHLSDYQCSTMEMLPLSLPRPSSSVPSLIAVPLRNIGLTEQESSLQSGVAFVQGNPSHRHLSAFVFEQCRGLVQPSGVDMLPSTDVKQELPESRASTDSISVKVESTAHSHSPVIDHAQTTAAAVQCCDAKESRISAATFTVKQEL